MAIEIVDFPIQNGGSFHSYVKLPKGIVIGVINTHQLIYPLGVKPAEPMAKNQSSPEMAGGDCVEKPLGAFQERIFTVGTVVIPFSQSHLELRIMCDFQQSFHGELKQSLRTEGPLGH